MSYNFDNHLNPFNVQGSKYFYVAGDLFYLSKNNIIEIKSPLFIPVTTAFEYQRNGLPNKFTTEDANIPLGSIRSTYIFEFW